MHNSGHKSLNLINQENLFSGHFFEKWPNYWSTSSTGVISNYKILFFFNGVLVWYSEIISSVYYQKQPPRGVLMKRCSENMRQIYRRTRMLKCDFNKVALLKSHFGMGVLLQICYIFSEYLYNNASGGLLLFMEHSKVCDVCFWCFKFWYDTFDTYYTFGVFNH